MEVRNIFESIPESIPEELFEKLGGAGGVVIERIVSCNHSCPEGFWYDQNQGEWVLLLRGSAALKFDGEEELILLKPGDWIDIPAHVRHRVEWTDPKQKTVWLAVFYCQ